jgi:hypothetical protein
MSVGCVVSAVEEVSVLSWRAVLSVGALSVECCACGVWSA